MPLDRLVLILIAVIAAAAATIWLAAFLIASASFPGGLALAIPVGLIAYVVWRVIAERRGNAEDDHYDRME